jgi:hypothetical protein
MKIENYRVEIWQSLQSLGFVLLMISFVFQLAAPAANAAISETNGHAHHDQMADVSSKCPMLLAIAESSSDGATTHDHVAQCVLLTCCFHDIASSFELMAVGTLLPDSQIMDLGTAPSSIFGPIEDRPPIRF